MYAIRLLPTSTSAFLFPSNCKEKVSFFWVCSIWEACANACATNAFSFLFKLFSRTLINGNTLIKRRYVISKGVQLPCKQFFCVQKKLSKSAQVGSAQQEDILSPAPSYRYKHALYFGVVGRCLASLLGPGDADRSFEKPLLMGFIGTFYVSMSKEGDNWYGVSSPVDSNAGVAKSESLLVDTRKKERL